MKKRRIFLALLAALALSGVLAACIGKQTEQEARLAAVLAEVEGAGNVSVLIAQEAGSPVSAVVLFDGTDGILVRLRLTQITAQALNIAENKVLVCPAEVRK